MNGTRIGTDFKLGSTITYQCDSGYKIIDPSTITCVIGIDGKPAWNRALPSCNGMYCMQKCSFLFFFCAVWKFREGRSKSYKLFTAVSKCISN